MPERNEHNLKTVEIKIQPDASLITVPLGAVRAYAANYFEDKKTVERIVLAVEEALNNVFSYSLADRMEHITVTAEAADGEFTVSVLDRGLPGDYEQTLKGEARLGLTLMENIMDEVSVENRGFDGRRQRMVKYYSRIPDLDDPAKKDESPIENAEITVRSPKKDEMLELGRLFYQEYVLTYPNDIVYYPDRFYAAVAKDQIHSTVAVDQFGNVAGHHATWRWTNVPGAWEEGMAVVSSRYRNAGILKKMVARTGDYVLNEAKVPMFLNGCVMTHPYSQKTGLSFGHGATGFIFNAAPPEIGLTLFKKDGELISEAMCIYIRDHENSRTVYIPEELTEAARIIYGSLRAVRELVTDDRPIEPELTVGQWTFSPRMRNGNINYTHHGKDFAGRLHSDLFELKERGAETVTLYLSLEQPGLPQAYEAAKAEGFFFTAIIPCVEQGDVLQMQKQIRYPVNYDKLVTVEPWTSLLEIVRKLDPDQN